MTDFIFDDDLLEELLQDDDGKENSASHVAATPQQQTHPPGAAHQHQASRYDGNYAPAYNYGGPGVNATGSGANAVQSGVNVNMQVRPCQARAPAQHCAQPLGGAQYNFGFSSRHGDCRLPVQTSSNGTVCHEMSPQLQLGKIK